VGRIALSVVLGYVVGSFPTAYLFVRWKSRIDIRNAGSGNVGALNSFEVTRSWSLGVLVLLADLLKGVIAALVGGGVAEGSAVNAAFAGVSAVAGHNYPVWLGFRGGRGLATAAGAALVVCWIIVPAWLILWAGAYALLRSINPANALASVLLVLSGAIVPSAAFDLPGCGADSATIRWFIAALMSVILLRHIDPVREFLGKKFHPQEDKTRMR
jgi:glycerol-3-phosphate acyltransferase PlsY